MSVRQLARMFETPDGVRFFFATVGHSALITGFLFLALFQGSESFQTIVCIAAPFMIIGYILLAISKTGVKHPDLAPSDNLIYILAIDMLLGLICVISGLIFFTSKSQSSFTSSMGIIFFVTGFFILHGFYKIYKFFKP